MRRALALLGLLVLASLPGWVDAHWQVLALRALMYSLVVLSFSLVAGQLGLVSLLQTSFAGLAGYAVAVLGVQQGWPAGAAIAAALALVLASAALFGLVSLRAQGIGFMMLTLALGQMVWALCFQWVDVTQGMDGISGLAPPVVAGIDFGQPQAFYALVLGLVALAFWLAQRLVDSRFGLLLRGIQDNAVRMRALGHPVLQARLLFFVLASVPAGIGGILLAWETRVVTPVSLDLSRAVFVLTAAVIGGTRSLVGVPLGIVLMVVLEAVVSRYTERHLAVFGTVLVASVLLQPGGLAAWFERRGPAAPKPLPPQTP
jgi:branched-chain amino acid transport system permease protein